MPSCSSKQQVVIAAFPALLNFPTNNPFFLPMLAGLHVSTPAPLASSPRTFGLTEEDGDQIGGEIAAVLVSNLKSADAVDEWVVKHAALQQLDKEPWFRPAMDALAQELLKSSSFGAKFRL